MAKIVTIVGANSAVVGAKITDDGLGGMEVLFEDYVDELDHSVAGDKAVINAAPKYILHHWLKPNGDEPIYVAILRG